MHSIGVIDRHKKKMAERRQNKFQHFVHDIFQPFEGVYKI